MPRFRKKPIMITAFPAKKRQVISTLEGDMVAEKGDWIVIGVKGEWYPVKPEIFAKTYEYVGEDDENSGHRPGPK